MGLRTWLSSIARPAAPEMEERGTTGTPVFGGGFLRDLGEYNSEFQGGPFSSFRIYEQMRRGDAQVAATLMAIKLPIQCAEWAVMAPEGATPVEKEAAEFIEENLFERLDWNAVLANALLMLDFGCAAHEDVWEIDGGQVVLKKAAPRLPMTFYNWIMDPESDDLVALRQAGYKGGAYVYRDVPVEKLALFTHQQEGGNYSGLSLLRPMYQHWYIKSNLYKIDAIAAERNGMGVPWIRMAGTVTPQDRKLAFGWLENLTAHQRASILLPPDWEFGLRGVEGTVRDSKESIAHHNTMISMAGLAMFMMLGQSHSGNRALGDTMADFFYLSLQTLANKIGRVISLTTAKRLVDFNFAGVERYPTVAPQQILAVKFESVVDALQKLAASSVVTPDEDLEGWVREKIGAPKVVEGARKAAAAAQAAAQDALAARTAGEDIPPGKDGAENAKPGADSGEGDKPAEKAALMEGDVHIPAAMGTKLRRAPRGVERSLALDEIVGALDRGRDDVAAALRAAKSRVQAEVVAGLMSVREVAKLHRWSMAPDAKLIGQVEGILRGVYEFGARQVADERARQGRGAAPADAAEVRVLMAEARKKDAITLQAEGVVTQFQNTVQARATNLAAEWLRRPGNATTGEIIRAIDADLDEQSDKWIDGVAGAGANEAFAEGRADGYEENKDDIEQVIYSALLDINTCGNCAAADGAEGAVPEDIPDVPNPDCDGGDRCRCVHVYVFKGEVKSAA